MLIVKNFLPIIASAALAVLLSACGSGLASDLFSNVTQTNLSRLPEIIATAQQNGRAVIAYDIRPTANSFWGNPEQSGSISMTFRDRDTSATLRGGGGNIQFLAVEPGEYVFTNASVNLQLSNTTTKGGFSPRTMSDQNGNNITVQFTAVAGQVLLLERLQIKVDGRKNSTQVQVVPIEPNLVNDVAIITQQAGVTFGRLPFTLTQRDPIAEMRGLLESAQQRAAILNGDFSSLLPPTN